MSDQAEFADVDPKGNRGGVASLAFDDQGTSEERKDSFYKIRQAAQIFVRRSFPASESGPAISWREGLRPAMAENTLLTVAEAAALLRLKPSTVRAWILRRKLAYCKVGRLVRIRRCDVDALLAASLVPASERQ